MQMIDRKTADKLNTHGKRPDAETFAYTQRVLDLIAKAEITADEADWVTSETVNGFRDHVNPGFLEYRKATSVEHAAAVVEWSDAGANGYRDVTGGEYIDCLGEIGRA